MIKIDSIFIKIDSKNTACLQDPTMALHRNVCRQYRKPF